MASSNTVGSSSTGSSSSAAPESGQLNQTQQQPAQLPTNTGISMFQGANVGNMGNSFQHSVMGDQTNDYRNSGVVQPHASVQHQDIQNKKSDEDAAMAVEVDGDNEGDASQE